MTIFILTNYSVDQNYFKIRKSPLSTMTVFVPKQFAIVYVAVFSVVEIQMTRINCAGAYVLHAARDVFSTCSHVVFLNRIVHTQPLNKGKYKPCHGQKSTSQNALWTINALIRLRMHACTHACAI